MSFRMDAIESQVNARTAMVQPIFQGGEIWGCRQIIGNASGGTQKTTIAIDDVRKYQGNGFLGEGILRVPSRNSPQCLHLMAAS